MSKRLQTICALIREDDTFEAVGSGYVDQDVCVLEAYSSYELAFDEMDTEVYSHINELIFKGCKDMASYVFLDAVTDNIESVEITSYNPSTHTHYRTTFRIDYLDLVL